MAKKSILLKLTGTIFIDAKTKEFTKTFIMPVIKQIKQLRDKYQFGIVIGGGDFFRGSRDNDKLGLRPAVAHTVGMIATAMNGLMLYDLLQKANIESTILCALDCPIAGNAISQQAIDNALAQNKIIIFSGGTGNPYVSTDTNAVIRAQQIEATELWKGSDIDGVYTDDPQKNKNASLLQKTSYQKAIEQNLKFMDQTALTLAKEGLITTRIFNIFSNNALVEVAKNKNFGSTINKG